MEKRDDYYIGDIYQGGYSSFQPGYGDTYSGYHLPANTIGTHTLMNNANQLSDVNRFLNQGIVPIELQALDPKIFDQIPKQQFKEINRLAKLTGAKISLHAPMIEPSGIDPEGRRPWTESERQLAEQQLTSIVDRAIEADDKGGMPITIHSAGIPGTEYKMTPEGKKVEKLIVINQETGRLAPLEEEKKFYPTTTDWEKGEIMSPERELKMINETEWDNSLSQLIHYKENADRIIRENEPIIRPLLEGLYKGEINPETLNNFPEQRAAYSHILNAQTYLQDAQQNLSSLFNKAYQYGTEEDKKELQKVAEQFRESFSKNPTLDGQSQTIQDTILALKAVQPKLYVPIEEFAISRSADTFSNVALDAYQKYKDKAPVISIENFHPGAAFAYGEGMEQLIKESRRKFVEKAVEKGISKSEAETQADKMIGMTLDVGHINVAKKSGFEDKDIAKEVEQIAKYVKHVHLTDNFGYGDSHLAPGMGNVPIKEIFKELEKKGYKGSQIIEAGGFVQHFKESPFRYSLEAMGSPIYSMYMTPFWNQRLGFEQGYYGGAGQMLPSINYETFGAGFSQLPSELGGQRAGQGSRMSGRPME